MDMDKLLRWREFAQKAYGNDFWSEVFDNPGAQDLFSGFSKMFQAESKKFPPVDVFAGEHEVIVLVEIPGIDKQDVQLYAASDLLKIKGNVRLPHPNHKHVTKERFYGAFEREVKLPVNINKEKVAAKYSNGLLEIRLVKEREADVSNVEID